MQYLLLLGLTVFSVCSAQEKPCVCPLNWKPVCGNDGETYPNECILNCVKVVLKPDLKVAYQGACKHSLQTAEEKEVVGWKNPCECPRALHRVCGSDGNTYSNPCMLNCAKHEGNPDLVLVHEGPCDPHDHDFEDPCECDNKFEPVCGTDHITYSNLCHLECATFTTSPGVEVEYEGECHAETELLRIRDPCACFRNFIPVCGSDGKTYGNPCMLNCAAETKVPGLKLVHHGRCQPSAVKQVTEAFAQENKEFIRDPCYCTKIWKPVCGTDGRTYGNECTLNCAKFRGNPDLNIAKYGRCSNEPYKVPN